MRTSVAPRAGLLGLVLFVALPTVGDARVVCEKRSGVLTVREACKRKEKQVDLGALGVVGPAGAPGGPGPQGPQGFQGPPGPGQVLGVFTEASNGQMQNALLAVPNVATLTYDCLSSQAGSNRVRLYLAERTGAPIWSTRTPLYTLPGTESVFFDLIGTTTMASSLIVAVDSVVINVAPSTTITVWSVIQPTIGNCRLSAQAVTGS